MGFGFGQAGAFCHGGGFGGFSMMIGGLLLAGLLIYGLIALVRREQAPAYPHDGRFNDGHSMYPEHQESPLAILDERYAKGELSDEEYAKRKSELKKRSRDL